MNIKVCGITTLKQLRQLDGLGIQYAGISLANVQDPELKNWKDDDLDIKVAGIFRNPEMNALQEAMETWELDLVQLDGDESPFLCDKISAEWEVIKTIRVDTESEKPLDAQLADYDEACDYFLFEPVQPSWNKKRWEKLLQARIEKPFLISGGFIPPNAADLLQFRHPDFFGISLNQELNEPDGSKNMGLLLQFLQNLKPASR